MRTKLHHQRIAQRQAQPSKRRPTLRRPMVVERDQPQDWEEGEIAARVRQRLAVLLDGAPQEVPAEAA